MKDLKKNSVKQKNERILIYIFLGFVLLAIVSQIKDSATLIKAVLGFLPIAIVIITFAVSQIIHEYGHWISHMLNNRKTQIIYNKWLPVEIKAWDTKEKPFTKTELKRASYLGIIAGLIPIWTYGLIVHNMFYLLTLDLFYLYASRFDLVDILGDKLYIFRKRNKDVGNNEHI